MMKPEFSDIVAAVLWACVVGVCIWFLYWEISGVVDFVRGL